jgi:hypothetical protein
MPAHVRRPSAHIRTASPAVRAQTPSLAGQPGLIPARTEPARAPLAEVERPSGTSRAAALRRLRNADAEGSRKPKAGGRPRKTLDNNSDDIKGFPSGTSRAAALRRLRKDRPDIHAFWPARGGDGRGTRFRFRPKPAIYA